MNEDGNDIKTGEIGEIWIRCESNMIGYYNDEMATKLALVGDWLKSGDLARVDEDGYIWIVDRKKDLIITGGVNIYPKEIEDVILQFPGIHEVAVIGIPHPKWGETVKAVFSASEEIDSETLKSFLRSRLAKFKVPRLYEQVGSLPRNASGKILKQPLRERGE